MKIFLAAMLAVIVGTLCGVGWTWAEFSQSTFQPELAGGDTSATAQTAGPTKREVPKVELLDGTEHDFGVMEKHESKSHAFRVKNVGNAPLRLTKLDTSCTCTVSGLARDEIPPGEIGEINLEWSPKAFANDFRQHANIRTNDPRHAVVRFEVHGRVLQSLRTEPESLVFSNVPLTEARSASLRVYCYSQDAFELSVARLENNATAPYFDVQIDPLPATAIAEEPDAKSGKLVTVTIKLGIPLGPIRQVIFLKTNIKGIDDLPIEVHGSVAGDISIVASKNIYNSDARMLTLGTVNGEKGATFKFHVLVKGVYAKETKLSIAEVDPKLMQVSIDMEHPSVLNDGTVFMYPMTIEIPPGSPAISRLGAAAGSGGSKLGKIVLEASHSQTQQVLLYVQIAVES